MKTKLFTCLFFIVANVALSVVHAEIYSGNCGAYGNNLTWSLNTETYTLTITGSGEMADYSYSSNEAPWYQYTEYRIGNVVYNYIGRINLPYGLTTIGNRAFTNCAITSIVIPNTVTLIGEDAFYWCSYLHSVTIPNSVKTIEGDAFLNCSRLDTVYIQDLSAWCNISFEDMDSNPLCHGCDLYVNNDIISDLVIPNGVTTIKDYAFCGFAGKSVTIPSGVKTIGKNAFDGCGYLTSIVIPNSVSSIDEEAFQNCRSLLSITIPDGMTRIAYCLLYGCESLTSVSIPNSVTEIGWGAFCGGISLNSLRIPDGVKQIAYSAFDDVPNVIYHGSATGSPWRARCINGYVEGGLIYTDESKTELCACPASMEGDIIIPHRVTTIRGGAFRFCSKLTTVTIPNSVTSIGYGAFTDVPNIVYQGSATGSPWGACCVNGYVDGWLVYTDESKTDLVACSKSARGVITIPNTVCEIRDNLFNQMIENTTSPHWNSNSERITTIILPNSIQKIGSKAFQCCRGLTSITIPNSVTSIGNSAFQYCTNLTNMTMLGDNVEIDRSAFASCKNIKSVTVYAVTPPDINPDFLSRPFDPVTSESERILYVLSNSLDAYKNSYWQYFFNPILPIGAVFNSDVPNTINIIPTVSTANITWPQISGAATYELVIKDKDGNVICTLVFNAQGQLLSIAFAPGRDNATEQTQAAGFSFTVTGLEAGTTYSYTLTAKDSGGKALDTQTGSFTTNSPTGIVGVISGSNSSNGSKFFHNGRLYILRDGKTYTATGQQVK